MSTTPSSSSSPNYYPGTFSDFYQRLKHEGTAASASQDLDRAIRIAYSQLYDLLSQVEALQTGTGTGTVTDVTGTSPINSTGGATPDISVDTATAANLGVVQVDGVTITAVAGVISAAAGGGTVTNVTATSPLASSGGATPNISAAYHGNSPHIQLSDNTGTAGHVAAYDASGNLTDGGAPGTGTVTDVTATSPLTSSGGATPNIDAAYHGNSTKIQLSDNTGTSGHIPKFDASGNIVEGFAEHGNTSTVQLSDGTGTSTHIAVFDASGNLTDGGAAPSASPNFADNESPSGATGTAFTLAHSPSPTGSLILVQQLPGFGGIVLISATDFTLAGANITTTNTVTTGTLRAWYRY